MGSLTIVASLPDVTIASTFDKTLVHLIKYKKSVFIDSQGREKHTFLNV